MSERDEITEFFGEIISVYTSEQAFEDEILMKTGHPLINFITTNLYSKLIEPYVVENNEEDLIKKLLDSSIVEMKKIYMKNNNKEDWFYAINVRDCKLFCAMNEVGGFTLMIPSDY